MRKLLATITIKESALLGSLLGLSVMGVVSWHRKFKKSFYYNLNYKSQRHKILYFLGMLSDISDIASYLLMGAIAGAATKMLDNKYRR